VTTLTVVSYAINGRGMGHLTRQLAILRWIRRIAAVLDVGVEPWVITSSEADTLARREGVPSLKMPSKAMFRDADMDPARYLAVARSWVLNAIAGLRPDLLLVDTFAGGSFGELVASLELAKTRVLVRRRVRPEFAAADPYASLMRLYDAILEPATDALPPILLREREELLTRGAAREALGLGDEQAVYVSLGGGGDVDAAAQLPRLIASLRRPGRRLVVGAGPLYSGPEIRRDDVIWLDRYVPMELFPGLDAAVSAAGFNAFHELMYVGVPTVFVPQPRIADDQLERAQRAEAAGAGRVAPNLDAVPDLLESPGDPRAARALVPVNGARQAAVLALQTVLPDHGVAAAAATLTGNALRALSRLNGTQTNPTGTLGRRGLALARLLGADGIGGFLDLCDAHDVPSEVGFTLVRALDRKFPSAGPSALRGALDVLLPVWARFDDWMGAVSLLRAVPVQRTLPIEAFAAGTARWLGGRDDLFDAVADLTRLEGGGARPIAEALALLTTAGEA
jgi:UDP-N-acetylglucosamine--N-acetylmuramyl-(pentapeptide) pyrophosphoryl-undecaprenol N-acetylglucosamine transferase